MRPAGLIAAAAVTALAAAGAISYAVAEDGGAPAGAHAAPAAAAPSPSVLAVPAPDSADAGFARDMAVHHQQAVEMAYLVRDRTRDAEVRRLAYDIAQTQANQRGMLLGWLDLWGLPKVSAEPPMTWMGMGDAAAGEDGALMPGMATNTQLKKLNQLSGRPAEILFLQLMTAHHRGGLHMAQGCVARCAVAAEKRLARSMVDGQRSELQLMAGMLKERGAAPDS
ncbi:DUF305 domain-containing protein [Streptomyces similanensis]|uniref:DUF305 domain-containing protein n=1 Tax=Streptomyces similanensis TaxID=1274988 RepID=A0ABP9K766_9ACTN